jgi:AcrR family transcriptional regulator
MSTGSIRARVRAEITKEIKMTARRHLATDGANLSLRAVARDMGMVSSALYRYFASRDELLTALIIDGYAALADAVESADVAVADRGDLRARWMAICHAVRDWAVANSAEYALLFGSPVPGYAAPTETIAAASRTPAALVRILGDGVRLGTLTDDSEPLPPAVRADLAPITESFAPGLTEGQLARGMRGWLSLFGTVSFEVFGQLNNVVHARREFFDHQMRQAAEQIGV